MTDTLATIQSAVHVAKDKVNSFGGYNYRTAEGILAATKAALPGGATIVVSDSLKEVAGQIFVEATAIITIGDNAYSATSYAMHPLTKKGMDPSQITGTASSYARKYALAGLLALDDGSADPDASKHPYEPEPEPKFDEDAATERLIGLISKAPDKSRLDEIKTTEKHVLNRLSDQSFEKVKSAFGAASLKFTPQGTAQ